MYYLFNQKYALNMFRIIHQLHQNKNTIEGITNRPIEVTYQSLLFNLLDELFENIYEDETIRTDELLTSKHYQRFIQRKINDIITKYPVLTEVEEKRILKEDFQEIIKETLRENNFERDSKEMIKEKYQKNYKREIRVIYLLDFVTFLGKHFEAIEKKLSIDDRISITLPLLDSFYSLYEIELSKYEHRYQNKTISRNHPSFSKAREDFGYIINLYGSNQISLEEVLDCFNVLSFFKLNELYTCKKDNEECYVFKVTENGGNAIVVDWVETPFNDYPTYEEIELLYKKNEVSIKKMTLKIKETNYLNQHFKLLGHLS